MQKSGFGLVAGFLAVVLAGVFLFLPLYLIFLVKADLAIGSMTQTGEVTVGVAVILRTTARRLLRSGSSNLLRTTLGAFSRTSARAMTRRLTRLVMRALMGVIALRVSEESSREKGDTENGNPRIAPNSQLTALVLGFAGLALSFAGIIYFLGDRRVADPTATVGRKAVQGDVSRHATTPGAKAAPQPAGNGHAPAATASTEAPPVASQSAPVPAADDTAAASEESVWENTEDDVTVRVDAAVLKNGELTLLTASLLAGVPLLAYALLTTVAARLCGMRARYLTAIDGLLLQAYFTGSGSFLPMTTDIQYEGPEEKKHWIALIALSGMYLCHLILSIAGEATHSYALVFTSAMFLVYCFVYSFPIRPLEGQFLWSRSKLLWFAVWVPILLSFLRSLPPGITVIL